MGCIPNTKKPRTTVLLRSVGQLVKRPTSMHVNRKPKSFQITKACWTKVINFLNYSEVKQIGRVNRAFNQMAKQDIVLIKFFKNKTNDKLYWNSAYNTIALMPVMSFSDLKKRNSLSSFGSNYSTSDERNCI